MKSKLEQLMDLSPPLPVEHDMSTFASRSAFSSEAAEELDGFVDRLEVAAWDGSIITRVGRIGAQAVSTLNQS